jgi:hypothetical protein
MKKLTEAWLSLWLYVIIFIAGIILGLLLANWHTWDLGTKLFADATILLPLHVLEEWHFPGGFHTMYNLMKHSDHPDCYPMNQLSDMWTNLIGVIFGCTVLFIGVNPVFLIMQLFLCCAEIGGHLSGGIFAYRKFKKQGKQTIYNPGLFTAAVGYFPLGLGIIYCLLREQIPALWEIPLALCCSLALGAFSLKGVEKLCMDPHSPYGFSWGDGYFSRYIDL